MTSVTARVRTYKQPQKAFIPPRELQIIQRHDDRRVLLSENIHAGLVGMAVDYLTRFMSGAKVEDAFGVSMKGAAGLALEEDSSDFYDYFSDENGPGWSLKNRYFFDKEEPRRLRLLLQKIRGLDQTSIVNACKAVGYDVVARSSSFWFSPVSGIRPDSSSVNSVREMVERTLEVFQEYGPLTALGFGFYANSPAFSGLISSGDGDFLTEDTLWDLKVSKRNPGRADTLQVLIYWLMIQANNPERAARIKYLGFFNPRLNRIYRFPIEDLGPEVIDIVRRDVIGYV